MAMSRKRDKTTGQPTRYIDQPTDNRSKWDSMSRADLIAELERRDQNAEQTELMDFIRQQAQAAADGIARFYTQDTVNETVAAAVIDISSAARASINFQQVLSDLRAPMWAIEALSAGNGGDKTAAVIGHYNDLLVGAMNRFERATKEIQKAGVGNINPQVLRKLIKHCTSLRALANQYATASKTARSDIQKRLVQYVKDINPLLESVYRPPEHYTPAMKVIAEMLATRVDKGLTHKEAIKDILRSDPELCLRVFVIDPEEEINEVTDAHARKLVERHRLGVL